MPRLKLILNPTADRGHAAQAADELRQIITREAAAASSEQGRTYELTWVQTAYHGHAVELACTTADEGFDTVVAIGGDGTVHEVVNGLMQIDEARRPRLGVIPFGSGNDFVHNFGLPSDVRDAIRCVLGDESAPSDIGYICDGSGRCEYWTNSVGLGFSGAVNIATRRRKRVRGFMLYLVAVLETIFSKPLDLHTQLQVDGGPPTMREIAMLSICNGPREGGGFHVAPGAKMDDGLLTYVIMRRMTRLNMLRFLPIVMKGTHLRHTRFIEKGEAERIHVEADKTMAIHTDGEVFASWEADIREVDLRIVPAAVQVLKNC